MPSTPTNTSGGTTTSFNNTPQAVDDSYLAHEDWIFTFNVMANDLGGNAKILWSIDDSDSDGTTTASGVGDGTTDLLAKDAALVPELSDLGARIWIENGNIKYDTNSMDWLAAGQIVTDHFTYAIRLANGTLSWATVTVTLAGRNDAPTVSAAVAALSNEDAPVDLAVDLLAGAQDIDNGAVLHVSGLALVSGNAAGVTIDGDSLSVDQNAYNYLAVGESAVITYSYNVVDGHGGSVAQTATITIEGRNDAPTVSAAVTAGSDEDDPVDLAVNLLAGAHDDDASDELHVSGLVLVSGNAAGVTVNGDSLSVDQNAYNYLAVGESEVITYSYNVVDGHGGSVAQTATITIEGRNDAPTVSAAVTAGSDEDASSDLVVDLLAGAQDVDNGAVLHVADLTPTGGNATGVSVSGDNLVVDQNTYNYLAVGESEVITYSYNVVDGHGGSVAQTATITIEGRNDAPTVSVATGDSSSASLAETNSGLVATGTLSVVDPDVADVVSSSVSSVSASGTVGTLTNTQLLAMLSVAPASGLPANSGSANNLGWTFNSGTQAFDYLNPGQSLTLTYTLTVDDGHSGTATQTVTVVINGTADGVTLPAVFTGTGDSNDFDDVGPAAGSTITTSSVSGTDFWNGTNGNDLVNAAGGTDTIYGHDGLDQLNGEQGQDISIYGQRGNDVLTGGSGSDRIYGGSGDDTIYGNEAPVANDGGDTGDDLYGGSGADTLYGQGGTDLIIGGFGADSLHGGASNDVFAYIDLRDTGDTILDFTLGDRINLTALDANGTISGDQNFAWGGTTATANGAWFSVTSGNATVYVDTDGNTGTAELAITLNGVSSLNMTDFFL